MVYFRLVEFEYALMYSSATSLLNPYVVIGKKTKIGVFAPNDKIDEAKKAGADVVGNDDLIKKVKNYNPFLFL